MASRTKNYEYLDHTADIQLHSWGDDMAAAFEHVILAMFDYMTDLDLVDIDESQTHTFEVEGHDLESLLYAFMDEFLYVFSTEFFVPREVKVVDLDTHAFRIRVTGKGETFDRAKHTQGTEVKAITYSNMQIHQKDGRADIYVIVDI
eukprot:Opistho-2@70620